MVHFPGATAPVGGNWRGGRWLIEAPGSGRVGFLAPDERSRRRLRLEGLLLPRLAASGVPVPALIAEDEELGLQVRSRIPGLVGHDIESLVFGTSLTLDPSPRYRPDCPLTAPGRRLAGELGTAIARFHDAVAVDEAKELGFGKREPEDREKAETVLSDLAPDLLAPLGHLRRWEATLRPDKVLAHGDVHMFNAGVDAATGSLNGLFDFDAVSLAHRYEDLKFLPSNGLPFAEAALRAYGDASGVDGSLALLARFHVRAALAHFGSVASTAERFPLIIAWSRSTVRELVPEWMA